MNTNGVKARPSGRAYWFLSGLMWGVPVGIGSALVGQAFSWNVSATEQYAQTRMIADGLSKTSLLLRVLAGGEKSVAVERDGATVTIASLDGGQKLQLSRTEQVLLAWSVRSKAPLIRNRQHLIDALSEDHHYGTEALSPLSVQQFLAYAAVDNGTGNDRWIDDPTIMSVLTQEMARRFNAQLNREAKLTLWPRVARCIVTVDPVCWNKQLRMGGQTKGATEAPEVFQPVERPQTAGN